MDDMIKGYRRFRAGTWRSERSRFEELSRLGQHPQTLVIACSDSRTDPQMIFNAAPGELFVVPRGVEHCPVAEEETHVLLIEPTGTPNTGDPGTAAPRSVI